MERFRTQANWDAPGITTALAEGGYRTFGLDARAPDPAFATTVVSFLDEHTQ